VFCLDIVVACRRVSSTDVFFGGSSLLCIDVVYVLLACKCVIEFYPCSCSLYLGEVSCMWWL
jgi:hypothetical protein